MVGHSQNISECSSELDGLSKLASFRGPLLDSKFVIGTYIQSLHARKPKIPHGGKN